MTSATLTVTNVVGEVVKVTNLEAASRTHEVDLSAQPDGTYFLNIVSGANAQQQKISLLR
jgi:hypothetical protein